MPLTRGEVLLALDITHALDRKNSCCGDLTAPASGVAVDPLTLLPSTVMASARWNF